MRQQEDRLIESEESHRGSTDMTKTTDCRKLTDDNGDDVVSCSSYMSEMSSEPPSIVDDSSSAVSYDGADIIDNLKNHAFPALIESSSSSQRLPCSGDVVSYSVSTTSRVSELSIQPPSVVDDSSAIYDDDDMGELMGHASFPLESIQLPLAIESTVNTTDVISSASPSPNEMSYDDDWDDILNWIRSRRSESSLDDMGPIRPFEKETLEKLLASLPPKRRTIADDIVIDWYRNPPKEDLPSDSDNGLIPTSWLQVPFPSFQHLLKVKDGNVEWIRNTSHAFFDSFTSTMIDHLLFFWTESSEEALEEGIQDDCNPRSPTETSNTSTLDAPKPGQMVRGDQGAIRADECCLQSVCKSHKLNDASSVASMETLETHISKLSDDHFESSWTWRVAEV